MSQTAEYNTTTLIVDDTSNLISYSAGWTAGFSGAGLPSDVAEYMQTKHGASDAGRTANFSFTGTSVAVYGSLGSFDVYGVPVSSYSVDSENTGTYTAPVIQPGGFQTHVLFYQSPPLSAGTHQLVITNLNGTAPSVLWLDYILYDASQSTSETGGSTSSGGGPTSLTSISTPTSTPSTSPETSSSSNHKATGAIVGGVIGGLAFVALTALLLICYRKRRREQVDLLESSRETVTSFRYRDRDLEQPSITFPPSRSEERSLVNVLPIKSGAPVHTVAGSSPSPSGSSASRSGSITQSIDPLEASALIPTHPIVRHVDSGIRMSVPVDIPPEYTQD